MLQALPQIQELLDEQTERTEEHRLDVTITSDRCDHHSFRNENGFNLHYAYSDPSRYNVIMHQTKRKFIIA